MDQLIYGATMLGNKMFGSPIVKPDTNILLAQKGYFSKAAEGVAESIKQVFTGLTNKDYFQKEIYNSQIKPFQSWRDLWQWGKGEKNLSKGQITDKAIQATVGLPAEMVARGLNIGDKGFRFAAEGAVAETLAATEFNFKGAEKERFVRFPKETAEKYYKSKGLSAEEAQKKAEQIENRIITEGEESVFQQNNIVSDMIAKIKQGLSSSEESSNNPITTFASQAAKVFGVVNMPFVKTPLNIGWEVLNLVNPELALLQAFVYGVRGAKNNSSADILQAKKWMAHAAVGWSLLSAIGYLASIGAVSGDDEDEPYKAKEEKGKSTYERPKRVNISKIWRLYGGESTATEDEDVMVDLSWFGAPGMIMNMQANKYENITKEERDQMQYVDELLYRLKNGAAEGLTNSVFQGTLTAVDAIRSGRMDQWLNGMINVGTNFLEPATIAQFSRATRPYDYKVKGDDLSESLMNNLKARFFGEVKPKVNIWGEKFSRDGGVKDVALRMLGVSEFDKDKFGMPIFEDFKRTGNSDFFPPAVQPEVNGNKLNSDLAIEYETLVGQARAALVAPYVNDVAKFKIPDGEAGIDEKLYSESSDDVKIKKLKKLYDKGRESGKNLFLQLHPELKKKP
jgi:hypothetical protein